MPHKILLVDDNEDYTDSIKDILEDEGYEIETANSGKQACNISEGAQFDLVLMDLKMPGMNGVECFLRMKRKNPSVKVILVTAYAIADLIETAKANGILAVLKKPLDLENLAKILLNTLKQPEGRDILPTLDNRALCENLFNLPTECA